MDTYKTSAGKLVKIAEMNPHHLANAIKKLSAHYKPEHGETLAALRTEQERRGGPTGGLEMNSRTCLSCQWNDAGKCKRNPPAMVAYPSGNDEPIIYIPYANWPDVIATDWCGEYQKHREDLF